MSALVAVRRDGTVYVGERLAGYVDRHDPTGARRSHLWRGVMPGSRHRYGFKTRAEAVAWVTAGGPS